jgi:signal peptide peptidase SppA
VSVKVLLQALARPWFIEESAAEHWSAIATEIVIGRRADAVPNQDTRSDRYGIAYEFPRVNANGDLTSTGEIQLVRVEGPLMKYDYCGALGMESIQQGLRAANADDTVKSIVLLIDSPGGTVDGTHNLSREIKASKKPVVAFVNGMMCSAAYWIGSSALEVIADDANNGYNATIGSIGTMAMWEDNTKAKEALGVKRHMVYATKSKRKGAYSQEANSGNYERLIQDLDNLNNTFISSVKENRGVKLKLSEEDVLEGDVYDAKQALQFGLIDKVANFKYAVKRSLMLAKTIK